jgi:hypothetical protein
MQVSELKGVKAFRAFNAFHKLMLGLKMLPAYLSESYEDFFDRVSEMDGDDQEKLIREACIFVELDQDETESLLSFVKDPLGVPMGPASIKGMSPDQILNALVLVCKEFAKIKVDFVSESQKKN